MDGLKISQRKILFSAFKKKLHQEIKVAQFSGYVSEQSGYHHGEASLNGAIVNMAQDFVGSNNLNLLMPNGQFGTRLQGGKDHASERYIFTKLNPLTRQIFNKDDDQVLTYLDDDGQSVEPIYYAPIIPMVLVNGALGIGTGFATTIPCYNPKEIISMIIGKLEGNQESIQSLNPYYKGFKGIISQESAYKYNTYGCFESKGKTITITELPIGTWNESYVQYLEKCLDGKKFNLKDYKDLSTNKDVRIELIFTSPVLLNDEKEKNKFIQNFKLTSSISTTNMYLFNKDEKLKKYECVKDIVDEFVEARLEYYDKRKQMQIKQMENTLILYSNKYTFIMELLNDTIDLRKKKAQEINNLLESKKYDKIEDSYHYLTKMHMDMVNEENVIKMKEEYETIKQNLEILKSNTPSMMYISELKELDKSI